MGRRDGKTGHHSRTDTLGIPRCTFFQQEGPVSPDPAATKKAEFVFGTNKVEGKRRE